MLKLRLGPTSGEPAPVVVPMAAYSHNHFDTVPIEVDRNAHIKRQINQRIASNLDNELDLCAYQLVCRSTRDAVNADNNSFWRQKFRSRYEKPTWDNGQANVNLLYKQTYQKRRKSLMYGARFTWALGSHKPKEVRKAIPCFEALRDLIVEAYSEKKDDADDNSEPYESKNILAIKHFILNHDLLKCVFLPELRSAKDLRSVPQPLIQAIQIVLAPAMLSLDYPQLTSWHFAFPTSQQAVYGTTKIFSGINNLDVNLDWTLHHINFWKYHMVRQDEHTLYEAFADLSPQERPRFWSSQLRTGDGKLGKHWKGSYAYVDRNAIPRIRAGAGETELFQDEFNGDGFGSFQDMQLDLVDKKAASSWPEMFEEHLHSLTPSSPTNRAKTRAQHRSASPDAIAAFEPVNFQFTGAGQDSEEDFSALGWLNALPPQQGIPGWQRMTMMKYFVDEASGAMDVDALWAYEGVVLPGGQIMVGRWWCTSDGVGEDMYSGPFILWCVDGSQGEEA